MNDIYREHIIDHYSNPRNFGDLEGADVVVKEANASCGDIFQLALKRQMANGTWRIADIKFKGVGCAISTAAFSLLTERIKARGMTFEHLKQLTEQDMLGLLGIPVSPTRMKCATLPIRVIRKALE